MLNTIIVIGVVFPGIYDSRIRYDVALDLEVSGNAAPNRVCDFASNRKNSF